MPKLPFFLLQPHFLVPLTSCPQAEATTPTHPGPRGIGTHPCEPLRMVI